MNEFTFSVPQNIIVGRGSLAKLPEVAEKSGGKKAFIISGPHLNKMGIVQSCVDALKAKGIESSVFTETEGNPSVETVDKASAAYKESGADFIVALGGGSPMDVAKAVGVVARYGGSITEYEGADKVPGDIIPLIAVPTTAGTGSEVTLAAVITDETCHYKHAVMDYCLIPRYAFLDPGLSCSLPPDMTAYSGMDALTHAVEAYCNRFCSPKMKAHAKKAVRLIGANLLTAYREPENKEARMNMLAGSYEAGIAFTNAYVGYVHAIAHGIGGLYHVPHGEANAILLPKVLAAYGSAVYTPLARLEREVRTSVAEDESREETDAVLAEAFIERIRRMNRSMGIPEELAMLRKEDVPELAARALKEGNPNYPVPVIWEEEQMRVFLMEQVPK